MEIIEKCREAKYSEVKSLKWSVKLSNIMRNEVIWSEVNEAKWSGMRWSEVQYREGGELVFVGKVYRVVSDEK